MNDQTTITELIENCFREIYSEKILSDKTMSLLVENSIEFYMEKGYETVGDLRQLFLSCSISRMKSDFAYYESCTTELYVLLKSVRNLRVYFLADFVYDYFNKELFYIIDFEREPECDIWESFWYTIGQIGSMSHFNRSILLYDKYSGLFLDTEAYYHFTYSYFAALFQINYRMQLEPNYVDNLLVIDNLITQIPRQKKEHLDRILGNTLSRSFLPSQIGDNDKRYGTYLMKYFRPMLRKM